MNVGFRPTADIYSLLMSVGNQHQSRSSRRAYRRFAADTPSVRANRGYIGKPTRPPPVCAARGPPAFDDPPVEVDQDDDPLAQSEPEVEFYQTLQW